ncbi:hypothetical protein DFJ73DRAFT_765243 [Zopfochytrium polystomum]|nr:hypothetical protein DFJ73DRAFT_765243 [Zopfochytrium polystomum]
MKLLSAFATLLAAAAASVSATVIPQNVSRIAMSATSQSTLTLDVTVKLAFNASSDVGTKVTFDLASPDGLLPFGTASLTIPSGAVSPLDIVSKVTWSPQGDAATAAANSLLSALAGGSQDVTIAVKAQGITTVLKLPGVEQEIMKSVFYNSVNSLTGGATSWLFTFANPLPVGVVVSTLSATIVDVSSAFTTATGLVAGVINQVKNADGTLTYVTDTVSNVADNIPVVGSTVGSVVDTVGSLLGGVVDAVAGAATGAVAKVADTAQGVVAPVTSTVTKTVSSITGTLVGDIAKTALGAVGSGGLKIPANSVVNTTALTSTADIPASAVLSLVGGLVKSVGAVVPLKVASVATVSIGDYVATLSVTKVVGAVIA